MGVHITMICTAKHLRMHHTYIHTHIQARAHTSTHIYLISSHTDKLWGIVAFLQIEQQLGELVRMQYHKSLNDTK